MKTSEVPRAVAAGMSTASALGLRVDDAVVVHDSNRIAVRLLPCDVLARVAYCRLTHKSAKRGRYASEEENGEDMAHVHFWGWMSLSVRNLTCYARFPCMKGPRMEGKCSQGKIE